MKSYAEFCEHYRYEDDEVTQKLYREYKANFRLFEDFENGKEVKVAALSKTV